MYLPRHFAESDLRHLDALAAIDAFGTLISTVEGAPFATHLPVLYRREAECVMLIGHWARANPQWHNIENQRVLFIFHGPHAYVSPRWYREPRRHVPTWNYLTAHVYGTLRLTEQTAELGAIVSALAERYERGAASPWRFDAIEGASRLSGIVGFELSADRIEIKHKLSQNHPAANVEGVIAGLESESGASGQAVAHAMRAALDRKLRS